MKKVFAAITILFIIPFISHAKEENVSTQQFQIHFIGSITAAPCSIGLTEMNTTINDAYSHNIQLSACNLSSSQNVIGSNTNAANVQKKIHDSTVIYTVSYK